LRLLKNTVVVLLLIVLPSLFVSGEANAYKPVCGINGHQPTTIENVSTQSSLVEDDIITIQCSKAGNVWGSIKSTATLTNTTKRVMNYEKSGGSLQRQKDFNSMPGTTQNAGDVTLKRLDDGRTLTMYKSADGYHSLSFPSTSLSNYTDKIRYNR
jgi:hypothetical protein